MKHLLLTTIAAVVLVGTAFADPIHDAAIKGDVARIQAELDIGVNVDAKMRDGSTSLHLAAFFNRKEVVKLLMAEGAEINTIIDGQLHGAGIRMKGKTPLDLAVEKKHTEIANLLRKHGGKHGAINDAVAGGYIQAVEEHLAAGADVNSKDWHGYTPLHIAAARNSPIEIAELLIANGADVNAKDNYGETPLHSAVSEGHKEIAKLLVAAGADVNVKGGWGGDTPLDLAEEGSG
ncbi:ankyrin repeat domain-containing protein, partial [bacterium]|nr:ankyrin repeat domain-containing protein [bacterium]